MQSAPAVEGMYIHGLLHRIEGDYDNARAWYSDVCTEEPFTNYWGPTPDDANNFGDSAEEDAAGKAELVEEKWKDDRGQKVPAQPSARAFLTNIERFRKKKMGDVQTLEKKSREEIEALIDWCAKKFGTEKWEDVSKVWVRSSEENKKIAQDMISGGEGYRKF